MTNPLAGIELPDEIVDMNDLDETQNVLVYGPPGVGKTVLGGGADLIIATEKGVVSARRQGSKAKVWPATTWLDLRSAYSWVEERCEEGVLTTAHWITLDSGTVMQEHALADILETAVSNNEERDPDIPAIQDHQKWQNMFKRFIRKFNDLPVNVLYIATEMDGENEEGETIKVPAFQGKGVGISSWVCAQMSAVGYMKIARVRDKSVQQDDDAPPVLKEVRRILWQPTGKVFAKDRSDMCGKFTTDKSLREIEKLMKTIPEGLSAHPTPVKAAPPAKPPAKPRKPPTSASKAAKPVEKAATPPAEAPEKVEVVADLDDDD